MKNLEDDGLSMEEECKLYVSLRETRGFHSSEVGLSRSVDGLCWRIMSGCVQDSLPPDMISYPLFSTATEDDHDALSAMYVKKNVEKRRTILSCFCC